jgi:hypothetical protein
MWSLIGMSLLAVGLAASGCSRTDGPTSGGTAAQPIFIRATSPGTLGSPPPMSVSKFIKARDGGEIELRDIKVRFEKNGLSADATITLSLLDTDELAVRLEHSGVNLLLPATIKTDKIDRTNGRDRADITFMGNASGTWTPISSVRDGDKLSAEIRTFGEYAIGMTTASTTGDPQLIAWLDGAGYRTRLVKALKGGDVKYGRYTVTFPSGALPRDTYITVRDPGSGYLMCNLEPEGIHFNVPVDLEVDLKNTGISGSDWTIFWWNPTAGVWEDQEGTFSGDKVNAPLSHFSTYAPGKAGKAGW